METDTEAGQQGKSFWSFSKSDARWFVCYYILGFLAFRFDISRHHFFIDPMPTSKAALFAIPFAIIGEALDRIRNR